MNTIGTFDREYDNGDLAINDIALDESGKNILMLDGQEAVMRVLKHRVDTRKYECQYDMNKGVDYFNTIFQKSSLIPLWISNMIEEITNSPDIVSVEYFHPEVNYETQKLSYRCGVITSNGEEELNGEL
jgi:hypothetical protein